MTRFVPQVNKHHPIWREYVTFEADDNEVYPLKMAICCRNALGNNEKLATCHVLPTTANDLAPMDLWLDVNHLSKETSATVLHIRIHYKPVLYCLCIFTLF
eukprot:TRINITY_DN8965_c0_g1_i2.p1 TRINITY_DN8965_c0_g1~~TRINITY_DN8965_c0_g1_i2.p1  ORF type:complete len:101 (-),score=2.94 TRINITY_DN8965_c0_g1_i2:348-650(-)